MSITCEKCKGRPSTVLCIEEPEWPYDPVAGWFKCEECHAEDPDGWSYVLDAEQFGDTAAAAPRWDVERVVMERSDSKNADDWIAHAYELHRGGMSLKDVAAEVMKVRPYKTLDSARESLRVNFRNRGWEVTNTRRSPVVA